MATKSTLLTISVVVEEKANSAVRGVFPLCAEEIREAVLVTVADLLRQHGRPDVRVEWSSVTKTPIEAGYNPRAICDRLDGESEWVDEPAESDTEPEPSLIIETAQSCAAVLPAASGVSPRKVPSAPRDFVVFWRLKTLDDALDAGKSLDYAASSQYSRVAVGDTVWIVSVREGRLRLVGRIIVGEVADRDTAARVLGSNDLWQARLYILPEAGTTRPIVDIDIHPLVEHLRFDGSHDRLAQDHNGAVNGRQLQAMRRLAPESRQMLMDALGVS